MRKLFISGAIVMAATLPFFANQIFAPYLVSIIGILIVSVAAGLTSPIFFWSSVLNIVIALFAVAAFEYCAIQAYIVFGYMDSFFLVNQILALLFLVALYYGVKTMRGMKSSLNRSF